MPSERDKAKPWQFGIGGLIGAVTAFCVPLVSWTWSAGRGGGWEFTFIALAHITLGAAIGGSVGGLFVGNRKGFVVGYAVGGLIVISFWALAICVDITSHG